MSIIKSPLFTDATGALGNVIIYKVGNQIRMRTKPASHRDKKSAGQLAQRKKLKGCHYLYSLLDGAFAYSWRMKAKGMVMNGCNLFIKENIRNFNGEGEIADWANLKICAASTPFPGNWQVERTSSHTLVLRWDSEVESPMACEDMLQIGAYGFEEDEGEEKILFRVKDVRAIREEGECCFKIPESRDSLHLYACFKNHYTGEYTDSVYLGEWEAGGKL